MAEGRRARRRPAVKIAVTPAADRTNIVGIGLAAAEHIAVEKIDEPGEDLVARIGAAGPAVTPAGIREIGGVDRGIIFPRVDYRFQLSPVNLTCLKTAKWLREDTSGKQ